MMNMDEDTDDESITDHREFLVRVGEDDDEMEELLSKSKVGVNSQIPKFYRPIEMLDPKTNAVLKVFADRSSAAKHVNIKSIDK